MNRKIKFFVILFVLIVSVPSARAQNPPSGEDAGVQAERFKRREEEMERVLRQYERYRKAEDVIIEPEQKEVRPESAAVTFTLQDARITGSTLFPGEDFRPLVQPYLSRKVSFQDLEAIASAIKSRYAARGYLTTIVYIPEQEITDGKIEIRVVEGRMGKVRVEGNKWFSGSLIEKYIHPPEGSFLNMHTLQKDLLRLNLNSDLRVKAVVSPGGELASSDVILKVDDQFPWHIGAGFDNQGTRLSGKLRESVFLRGSNVTGNLDTVLVTTLFSSRSFGQGFDYEVPLNTYGTKLGLDVLYFRSELGKEYKPYDITGATWMYSPHILWELYLSEYVQAGAEAGVEIKSVRKKMLDDLTADDHLSLPYIGFEAGINDLSGNRTFFSPRFTLGTSGFLGSSSRGHSPAGREGTGGSFFKYGHSLNRLQRMPFESYLFLRSRYQAVSRTLPSSEQFQLGGGNSVRGYPEGDYLCDTGGELNVDWFFPFYLIPEDWRLWNSAVPLRRQIEPVIFIDAGGGKLKRVMPGENEDKFLAGIGGGFRLHLNNNFYLRLDWAKDIGDDPVGGSGPSTFYFTFQSEI